jgi:3,4-dihydroxy 2-butanone 4-phosphate synthase/GTP cyclohydrolase II
MAMTHSLRATHDAILVGIGTVLVDDPRLTVRLASGSNPQPVVLDSHLRLPLTAALLSHPDKRPWVAATHPQPDRVAALEALGTTVLTVPAAPDGRVALAPLLDLLGSRGIKTLMVEGGASVIAEFLKQKLANKLVVTISPQLLGGVHPIGFDNSIELENVSYRQLGKDMIVEAELATQ